MRVTRFHLAPQMTFGNQSDRSQEHHPIIPKTSLWSSVEPQQSQLALWLQLCSKDIQQIMNHGKVEPIALQKLSFQRMNEG